jgi:hypothetical protein
MHSHTSDHCACNHAVQIIKESLRRLGGGGEAGTVPLDAALRVLEAAQRRSRQLVTARPGSEALWYLRRMLWTILMDIVGKYCKDPAAQDAGEAVECDAEIDILGRIISTTIHENGDQEIEPRIECWTLKIDSSATHIALLLVIIRLVVGEAGLVASQARPDAGGVLWNEEKQREFALRYLAHVLAQVIITQ